MGGGSKDNIKASRSTGKSPAEVAAWLRIVEKVTGLIDRLGVALTVIAVLFCSVYFMGTTKTRDDFIRDLLFGDVTHTRWLSVFLVGMVLVSVFGLDTWVRDRRVERKEMQRLADERDKWQERALNTELSHTKDN